MCQLVVINTKTPVPTYEAFINKEKVEVAKFDRELDQEEIEALRADPKGFMAPFRAAEAQLVKELQDKQKAELEATNLFDKGGPRDH